MIWATCSTEKRIKQIQCKTKQDISGEQVAQIIDECAMYYEKQIKIGDTKILVLPLLQLIARSKFPLATVYSDPKYSDMTREEKNTFVAVLAGEVFKSPILTIFNECDEYYPSLVALMINKDTSKDLFIKCEDYRTWNKIIR